MLWINLVVACALVEYLYFAFEAGRARGRYGVKAPATTGHEIFERHYRVQMNTLELLVVFIPAMLIAAQYWLPWLCAAVGALFVIGRLVYQRAYVGAPASRSLGYGLSILPVVILVAAIFVGIVRNLVLR